MGRLIDFITDHQGALLAILTVLWTIGYLLWVVAWIHFAWRCP